MCGFDDLVEDNVLSQYYRENPPGALDRAKAS